MVIEWHEREHEQDDALTLADDDTIWALRECGLYKFFLFLNMRG